MESLQGRQEAGVQGHCRLLLQAFRDVRAGEAGPDTQVTHSLSFSVFIIDKRLRKYCFSIRKKHKQKEKRILLLIIIHTRRFSRQMN